MGPNKFTFNDELINGWVGVGTQLNSLGHVGIDHVYYNGNRTPDFVGPKGVTKLDVASIPPMVTRGIVIDMTEHYGVKVIPEGKVFTVKDIKAQLARQKLAIREGDVVIFNTGWMELIGKDNKRFLAGERIGMAAAKWLADQKIVAFGSDTWASEVVPGESKDAFPVNQYMLAKRGIYNLELIDARDLIADEAYEFLFVLGHPRYKGSTQAIINPVAIR